MRTLVLSFFCKNRKKNILYSEETILFKGVFYMGLGLEMMIIVALLVYVVTGLVTIGMLVWYAKVFGPMFKQMMKQMNKMYGELEDEEA
jgi:hypothetical protein